MLVVSAQWGLGDGTLLTPTPTLQIDWLEAVRRAAFRAGYRRDGRYDPIDTIDVVLAGDTCDALTTTAWLGPTRPWHEGMRAAGTAAATLVAAALRGRRLLAGLSCWARRGLAVPTADRRGRPAPHRPRPVPVRVTMLPGNRDRWVAAAGPRLARRGIHVAAAWSAGGITVCHGAACEPIWGGGAEPRSGRPTLGESLAVDLVGRFGGALRARPDLWPACRPLVARLASCREIDMPLIVADWLARTQLPALRQAWRQAVGEWRRQARRDEPECGTHVDAIGAVAAWMDDPWRERHGCDEAVAGILAESAAAAPRGGTWVFGRGTASAARPAIVGLGPAPWAGRTAARPLGVTVSCVRPVRRQSGPATVVFPDRDDPRLRWRLMADEDEGAEAADWSLPTAARHRVVDAA